MWQHFVNIRKIEQYISYRGSVAVESWRKTHKVVVGTNATVEHGSMSHSIKLMKYLRYVYKSEWIKNNTILLKMWSGLSLVVALSSSYKGQDNLDYGVAKVLYFETKVNILKTSLDILPYQVIAFLQKIFFFHVIL